MGLNIRTTLTGSVADMQRCSGRLKQAAQTALDDGDGMLYAFLLGASCGIEALTLMEYGDDESNLLTKVTTVYARDFMEDDGA